MRLSRGKNEFSFTSKYFTEDLAYMINVGEETGAVSNSIKNTGIIYEKELKHMLAILCPLSNLLSSYLLVVWLVL